MKRTFDAEVEKRIQAWADITRLSLELKRVALKKKYPEWDEQVPRLRVLRRYLPLRRVGNEGERVIWTKPTMSA